MQAILSIYQELSVTEDVGMKRTNFDEEKVSEAIDTTSTWGNPYGESSSLTNMASSLEAKNDFEKELEAQSPREFALGGFIEKRIRTNDTFFYGPIKRGKLKTFATMKAKKFAK